MSETKLPYTEAEIAEIREHVKNDRDHYPDSTLGAKLLNRDARLIATLDALKQPKDTINGKDAERVMARGRWSVTCEVFDPEIVSSGDSFTQYFATKEDALRFLVALDDDPQTTPRSWRKATELPNSDVNPMEGNNDAEVAANLDFYIRLMDEERAFIEAPPHIVGIIRRSIEEASRRLRESDPIENALAATEQPESAVHEAVFRMVTMAQELGFGKGIPAGAYFQALALAAFDRSNEVFVDGKVIVSDSTVQPKDASFNQRIEQAVAIAGTFAPSLTGDDRRDLVKRILLLFTNEAVQCNGIGVPG